MTSRQWQELLQSAADPQRARHYLDQLQVTSAGPGLKKVSNEQARVLISLLSGSEALSEFLVQHPNLLESTLNLETLRHSRTATEIRREIQNFLKPLHATRDEAGALAKLREFKQREMLRIATRDLARLATLAETVQELSHLADICLETVLDLCSRKLADRLGTPYHLDANERWQDTQFCVLGMGKLGGEELNYSSDVDLLFVYSEEGRVSKTPPARAEGKGITNHQFFNRLAESFVAEVGRLAPEGVLFRVDLRLRPEGKAGPLTRSINSYENYYAQWGQTWERMMLIKARPVAGNQALGAEFLEMIQSFRYPRSLNQRIVSEVAAIKQRTELEVVKAGEIDRNVKLGRGGIREIEFIVQTLQLLHAGKMPFLQTFQTLPALEKLATYRLLAAGESSQLAEAYEFLRNLEHRLQMENNRQTHTIPTERKARERLARLMGFDALADFEPVRASHQRNVRQIYDKLLRAENTENRGTLPGDVEEAAPDWISFLEQHSFRDPEKALHLVRKFLHGPGHGHVSARTVELARDLLPHFFAFCPALERAPQPRSRPSPTAAAGKENTFSAKPVLSDPDRVLARLDSFVSAYGTRAVLYEMWTTHPSLFEMMLLLFDRSEFLAEISIRTPDLVDELALSGRLRQSKPAARTLADLRHGLGDADQKQWIRRYHQAELMRIALRDILGLAHFEQNLTELSALADACLQYALEVLLRKHKLKSPPFCIVGLGKLGGQELNYGSDLDIVFIAGKKTHDPALLHKLATEIIDLLSSPTEFGVAFVIDTRLRPDGEKGLLVNTVKAHEDYYRQRAMLWEIQSLTRVRPVAGDLELGETFRALAAHWTNFTAPAKSVAAWSENWRKEIDQMRLRIARERTPRGKESLAIKTGAGGLMDVEFIAQCLCLANGWQEANTLAAIERGRAARALPESLAKHLIDDYRQLRRLEGILRRWSFAGETLLPDEPAALARVAVRAGFESAEALMPAVKLWRQRIHDAYEKFFK